MSQGIGPDDVAELNRLRAENEALRRRLDLMQGIGLRVVKLPDPDEEAE